MFYSTIIFFFFVVFPGIVNTQEMKVSGTVRCTFDIGGQSFTALLEGAAVEFWEEDNSLLGDDDDYIGMKTIITKADGQFDHKGDPEEGSAEPFIKVKHQCYSPSSKNKITKGHQYVTSVSFEDKRPEQVILDITVGVVETARVKYGEDEFKDIAKDKIKTDTEYINN